MNLTQQVTWIPVEERMPESLCDVIVALTTPIGSHMVDVALLHGKNWHKHEQTMHGKVTHWAEPLKHPNDL